MTLKKRKTQKQNQKKEKNHKQNKTQLGKNKPFRTVLTTELKMNWEDSKVIREKKILQSLDFSKITPNICSSTWPPLSFIFLLAMRLWLQEHFPVTWLRPSRPPKSTCCVLHSSIQLRDSWLFSLSFQSWIKFSPTWTALLELELRKRMMCFTGRMQAVVRLQF